MGLAEMMAAKKSPIVLGGFQPTDEQLEALRLFKTGENIAIEAGAGTGKTSTLALLANSTTKKGQYIAFNKSIVEDSKSKFPQNIKCSTMHSLAYGAIIPNSPYKDRLSGNRQRPQDVANFLGLTSFNYTIDGKMKELSADRLSIIVQNMVYKFCTSADRELTKSHFPFVEGIDLPDHWENHNAMAWYLEPFAQKYWNDVVDHNGKMQFKHEHYLKLYHLSDPVIKKDFILFDEAQDASPIMLDIVLKQDCQLVFVGDANQAIYAFTGAVNAMEQIPAENKATLSKSFRFGEKIADTANDVLSLLGADLKIIGFEKIQATVTSLDEPKCILYRTNGGVIGEIIQSLVDGKKVAYVGDENQIISFVKACADLKAGKRTMHPELMCFESCDELQMFASMNEDDKSLALMIRLINQYGAVEIINAFKKLTTERNADVIVSTAHKSKGREWDSVKLGSDFPDEIENASDE